VADPAYWKTLIGYLKDLNDTKYKPKVKKQAQSDVHVSKEDFKSLNDHFEDL
jgi:hypothetical protein